MKKLLLILTAAICALNSAAQVDTAFNKFRLGGYGEMLASWQNYGLNRWGGTKGSTEVNHAEISIPRFVLAFDYKFNEKWIFGAEIVELFDRIDLAPAALQYTADKAAVIFCRISLRL